MTLPLQPQPAPLTSRHRLGPPRVPLLRLRRERESALLHYYQPMRTRRSQARPSFITTHAKLSPESRDNNDRLDAHELGPIRTPTLTGGACVNCECSTGLRMGLSARIGIAVCNRRQPEVAGTDSWKAVRRTGFALAWGE